MQATPRHRRMWMVIALCLLAASSARAQQTTADPVAGAKPRPAGADVVPSVVQAAAGSKRQAAATTQTGSGAADPCETVGRRLYDLCMASPGADMAQCIREYDMAYGRCANPPSAEATTGGTASELSRGTYRIPYENGTKVHINRDFHDHNPPGKIDMAARGGGTHRIVAAAAGIVRFIEDSHSKQQHPMRWLRHTDDCNNNYVWIEHDNGEWSKYSHMQQGTTTGKAGLNVGDRVAEGTYLGDEGKVGCAWPQHLHFEIVVPAGAHPAIADPSGMLTGYTRDSARNPVICGLGGKPFQDGEIYFAAPAPDCAYEGSVAVGGACSRDVQCETGACNGDGVCQCRKDADCGGTAYCDEGTLSVGKNRCVAKQADNGSCAAVGGGRQCLSGECYAGHCYTENSVAMGGTCYRDKACAVGKCSAVDGAKGTCVCKHDADCGAGRWCDAGLDAKLNACHAKLHAGQQCGKAGSFGNDHKCESAKCSGFPKYECR